MKTGKKFFVSVLARGSAVVMAAAMTMASGTAAAQAFPSAPVKLVIPFPAGSGSDLVYRPVSELLSRALGQTVVLDPRPGGGSMVATNYVKSLPADGYTIYAVSNSVTIKSLTPSNNVDIRKDFAPIAPSNIAPMLILVNAEQVKATNVKELLAEAKARNGEMNYGSYGIGSGSHMFMELLLNEAKVRMVHVPYQGTAQAAADTAGGRVQVTGTILATARSFVSEFGGSGKLRLIGESRAERSPLLPNTPGMREAGFPDIDYGLWGGYVALAGTPKDAINKLNVAINTVLKDPTITSLYKRLGLDVVGGTPEDLTQIINREYDSYVKLIKDTGIKLQ